MKQFVATMVAFLAVNSAYAAGDPVKAEKIAGQVCAACHGVDGNSPLPMNPSLAGQHPEYLLKQLTEFKSGARNNPVMAGMVANLSIEDMHNLAAYYAGKTSAHLGADDKNLIDRGRMRRSTSSATARSFWMPRVRWTSPGWTSSARTT